MEPENIFSVLERARQRSKETELSETGSRPFVYHKTQSLYPHHTQIETSSKKLQFLNDIPDNFAYKIYSILMIVSKGDCL